MQLFVIDKIPAILESVFQSTLDLITANFEDNPDHRTGFYRLLRAVNKHCFLGQETPLPPGVPAVGNTLPLATHCRWPHTDRACPWIFLFLFVAPFTQR